VYPLQSPSDQRHILVHLHRTGLVDTTHLLVIQLLSGIQLLVHHLDYLCVVVVEIMSYERSVEQCTQNINQLSTTEVHQLLVTLCHIINARDFVLSPTDVLNYSLKTYATSQREELLSTVLISV